MATVFHLPPSNKFFPHQSAEARLGVPLDMAETERSAFLEFRRRRQAFRKTRSMADEIIMLEARNHWSRVYTRILQMGGAA